MPLPKTMNASKPGANAVPGELEVTDIVLLGQQPGAQGPRIGKEVLLKAFFPRPDVGQQAALVLGEGNNGPLVKDNFPIPGIHLSGARFNQL